jgi:hypothetical protein
MERKPSYASYLLRLRQVEDNRRLVWMPSLQSTATGEQHPFADLDALVEFLRVEFGSCELMPGPEPVA